MSQFRMMAVPDTGTDGPVYWTAESRDFAGAGYPGPGAPVSNSIAVLGENIVDSAGAAVFTVFGRSGNVIALLNDYGAELVTYNPAVHAWITATETQSAIEQTNDQAKLFNDTIEPITYAGVARTFLETDAGKRIKTTSLDPVVLTIPFGSSFPLNGYVAVSQQEAGEVSIVGAPGVVLNISADSLPKSLGKGGQLLLVRDEGDSWSLTGDLVSTSSAWAALIASSTAVANQFDALKIESIADISRPADFSISLGDGGTGEIIFTKGGAYSLSMAFQVTTLAGADPSFAGFTAMLDGVEVARAWGTRFGTGTAISFPATSSTIFSVAPGAVLKIVLGTGTSTTVLSLFNRISINRIG